MTVSGLAEFNIIAQGDVPMYLPEMGSSKKKKNRFLAASSSQYRVGSEQQHLPVCAHRGNTQRRSWRKSLLGATTALCRADLRALSFAPTRDLLPVHAKL